MANDPQKNNDQASRRKTHGKYVIHRGHVSQSLVRTVGANLFSYRVCEPDRSAGRTDKKIHAGKNVVRFILMERQIERRAGR